MAIISNDLLPYFSTLEIDKNREFTPKRVKKTKKGAISIFSDHLALAIHFKNIPKTSKTRNINLKLNTNKPNAWKKYEEMTAKYQEK